MSEQLIQDSPQLKVMVLYLAKRLSGRTEPDLLDVALNSLYMDYFSYTQAYADLLQQGFLYVAEQKNEIRTSVDGRKLRRVYLSELGSEILDALLEDLPLAIRQNIDREARNKREKADQADSYQASYAPDGQGQFEVKLSLVQDLVQRFELKVSIPDEALAKKIVQNWKENAATCYAEILSLLCPFEKTSN